MTDVKSVLVAASAVAEREAALDELAAQAQEHDMGYGKEADVIDEFKLSEAKIAIAREEDTIRRLLERAAEALEPYSKLADHFDKLGQTRKFAIGPSWDAMISHGNCCEARSVLAEVRKALEMMK